MEADLLSWRKRVEKELATTPPGPGFESLRTTLPDGLTIEPLYVAAAHPGHVAAAHAVLADEATTIEAEAIDLRALAAEPAPIQLAQAIQGLVRIFAEGPANAVAFEVAVGPDMLREIAKLRALRRLAARVIELAQTRCTIVVHAFANASDEALGTRLIATSVAVFAAITGGADRVTATALSDTPEQRRLADNVVRLALHESHLAAVADPAAGSYALESLTHALCERAWQHLQEQA